MNFMVSPQNQYDPPSILFLCQAIWYQPLVCDQPRMLTLICPPVLVAYFTTGKELGDYWLRDLSPNMTSIQMNREGKIC